MITLCYGSNVRVDCIDLSRCNPYKDFGRAFYMASDREQAQDVALARVDIFGGEPVVNEYRFDETLLADGALSYGQHRQKGVSPAAEVYERHNISVCVLYTESHRKTVAV